MRKLALILIGSAVLAGGITLTRQSTAAPKEHRYLYVATPGIRNYVEYGGVGILVYDIDHGYKWVKRIPTWDVAEGKAPENVKGIAANAQTSKIYISTPKRIACFDLITVKKVCEQELEGGCDRMALSPDGRVLYVPSFEGPHWNIVEALDGRVIKKIVPDSGAHNTVYGPDGKFAYLAGLRSLYLSVADTTTHSIAKTVGPFTKPVRPFTINGSQTLSFVNINELLGFEVGDIRTGRMLHRVEVAGFQKGPVKRHGCPSHGIAMTVDEREIWLCDAFNERIHIFDARQMPPKQKQSLKVRDQPGWISFSIDGKRAYPSTGEVIDVKTKRTLTTLTDEEGRAAQSEKMLEIVMVDGRPVRAGDQFGIGQKR